MASAHGYAAAAAGAPLAPFNFNRRAPGPNDVAIQILYCGICHSDIHLARDEWGGAVYPMVPGHEIVGRVTAAGTAVTQFRPGDLVGVGCMVGSCGRCGNCREGLQQYCDLGATLTYNAPDPAGGVTYGGYSDHIVVDAGFVLRITHPAKDLAGAAPLLCAGITTYSPLRHWKVGRGSKVGVMGLGGLGHMALKLAHAFGAEVVQFTRSATKGADARRLGADAVVVSSDEAAMRAQQRRLDFILDTVAAPHDLSPYLSLLKRDGTLVVVGAPDRPFAVPGFSLILGRRALAGSLIGGVAETQEMLDFCASNGIVSEVEVIPIQDVNQAFDRVVAGDVRYRFTIDMASLPAARA
ncbi:MAG: NAD(P)-dependent alcohol dehydrogenase [Terriglobales bacterium]